jgi:Rrf2 family transcriptional regulator, cysteine metabolism repressor
MALMSRKVDYALLILAHLRQHPEGDCARAIAARYDLSRPFVANILKELCHTGFVSSHRGVKGGYALQRPAEQITLCEIMEALDEPFHLAECTRLPAGPQCCLLPVCPVKDAVAAVHARIRALLGNVTLADLFQPAAPAAELVGLETTRCRNPMPVS